MQKLGTQTSALQMDGVVHGVDTVNRELTVNAGGTLATFEVPPDCAVVLRGERVKLRMVQPRDRVQVTYTRRQGFLVARTIQV
jgi:hypothetical protein